MSDEKKAPAKKSDPKVSVVLRGISRAHKSGDKVSVPKSKADALVRDGLADLS